MSQSRLLSPATSESRLLSLPVVPRQLPDGSKCAWWDSLDGVEGGLELRVRAMPTDTRKIYKLQLFPPGPAVLSLTTKQGNLPRDFAYLTVAPINADEFGPVGLIFTAPPGTRYPRVVPKPHVRAHTPTYHA